jgi:hypothetical protein
VLEASPVAGERQFSVDLSKLVFMVSGENIVTHLPIEQVDWIWTMFLTPSNLRPLRIRAGSPCPFWAVEFEQ